MSIKSELIGAIENLLADPQLFEAFLEKNELKAPLARNLEGKYLDEFGTVSEYWDYVFKHGDYWNNVRDKLIERAQLQFIDPLLEEGEEKSGYLTLWRILKNVKEVRTDRLGKHWTFVPMGKGGFSVYGRGNYLLMAKAPFEAIDLNDTLAAIWNPSILTSEQEIVIGDQDLLQYLKVFELS